ncbi:MAG TPA: electron transfer flavoprotein subunit alpha/FixB family protein [Anaeromyxobacter sp.]|nr:electron transfer flavoprotein subunit alpha/FixB family protein [Anaeromyxobacter sp.]
MSVVLIVAEQSGGALRKATLHALAAGRDLARRTGGEVRCVLAGQDLGKSAEVLAKLGTPVHLIESPSLAQPVAAAQGPAIAALVKKLGAGWVGAAATAYARDLIPRVAARLGAAMATEVLAFVGEGGAVTMRRPMWAGNVLAEVELTTPVKAFTIRATEFPTAAAEGPPGQLVREAAEPVPDPRTRHLGFTEQRSARPELTEARVVVSGGRGTKGDFKAIEELADALGGAVGASRAAVDAGWVPNDWQVGQTGKVVAPELYVAAGISGAIQHLAGMKGARVIVAVNKDPEAPIFQIADYGVVADLFQVLPALAAKVKASR